MRKNVKRLVAATAVVVGLAATPALYAYAHSSDSHSSTMGQDMMGGSMMGMMGQMGEMAQNCNAMMTSMVTNHGMAPNEQWKHHAPQAPEDQHQGH